MKGRETRVGLTNALTVNSSSDKVFSEGPILNLNTSGTNSTCWLRVNTDTQ